jgi:hypothetical protein
MLIGRFELPDGGELEAFLVNGSRIECRWPVLPLSRRNRRYYLRRVGPVLIERAKTVLGVHGKALWVLV